MFDPVSTTAAAAAAARDGLTAQARRASADERGAAGFARAAVFQEALLDALRARFAELKTAAK